MFIDSDFNFCDMSVDYLFIMLSRSQSVAETMFIGFMTFVGVSIFFALPGWIRKIRNSGKKNWDEISKNEKNQKNNQNSDWDDTNNQ